MKGYTPREAHDNSEMAYFILATSYNHVVFNSIEHNVQSVALVADLYLLRHTPKRFTYCIANYYLMVGCGKSLSLHLGTVQSSRAGPPLRPHQVDFYLESYLKKEWCNWLN